MTPSRFVIVFVAVLSATSVSANAATEKGNAMTRHAQGPFDVKVAPVAQDPHPDGITLGQMDASGQRLTIVVVPGSGTGELAGLEGKLEITIAKGGAHSYDLAYTLPTR
jgi:uncharacterized protein DUF3224